MLKMGQRGTWANPGGPTDAYRYTSVGRPQEEGMMSTAASFPSVRNQGSIEPVGERNHF